MITAEEIVAGCNELAREFYKMRGYEVQKNYKFYEAHHPEEIGCWAMAVVAYDRIQGTDVESALDDMQD